MQGYQTLRDAAENCARQAIGNDVFIECCMGSKKPILSYPVRLSLMSQLPVVGYPMVLVSEMTKPHYLLIRTREFVVAFLVKIKHHKYGSDTLFDVETTRELERWKAGALSSAKSEKINLDGLYLELPINGGFIKMIVNKEDYIAGNNIKSFLRTKAPD